MPCFFFQGHMVICCYIFVDNFSHDSSASSIVPPHKISKIKSSSSTVFSTSCLFQASPKFPSASNASKTLCVSESAYFAIHDTISEGDNCKLKFSLTDIAGCVGFQGQDVKNSERYALECFSHYFKGFDQLNNIKLICDKEILQMKRLEGLETSTAARIDIVVRQNDYFVLGIEVLSGPKMSETISKCIIGAADTLRMLRLDDEKEVNGVTFFAVPSLSHPGCVVKVEVVWQHLQFHSTLTYYFEAQESIEAIKDEAIQQLKFCNLIPSNVNRPPLIKLYDNDIKFLDIKDGVQQYSQRHIIIEDNNFIYKVLYRSTEKMAVFDLLTWQYSFKKIINVVRYYRSNKAKYLIYCYRKVKFRPLRLEEASQCLRPLLRSVSKAIEELHGYNLSHNDIRLPNICFNEDYEAVLIDIDSTCGIDRLHDYFINGVRSCMYNVKELQIETRNVTGKQTDYMQLGWMVTYILDPSADEHDRTFQSLKDDIKELKFVVNLIQKGSWDENLFKDFCLDSNTELRDIISE